MNMFSTLNYFTTISLHDTYIPNLVTSLDNLPDVAEIKRVVFDLNGDGAQGPDGFVGHFYQHYWSIVGSNLLSIFLHK